MHFNNNSILLYVYLLSNSSNIYLEKKRIFHSTRPYHYCIFKLLLEIIIIFFFKLTKNMDQNQNKEQFRHVDCLKRPYIWQGRLLILSLICTYISVIGQTMSTWMHSTNFHSHELHVHVYVSTTTSSALFCLHHLALEIPYSNCFELYM